ncbi:hypothetical protein GGS24DRAFT_497131 [Hypoxylon argillaceum]|nr:hypothetical protein GGS24DRAFT_497131 [Hypoxylon argillaceum]
MAPRGSITPRTIMAPAAAFCMACVLFANKTGNEGKAEAYHLPRLSRIRTDGGSEATTYDSTMYILLGNDLSDL